MTRRQGELVEWNDDRGFGFIAVDGDPVRLFVHVKAIRQHYTRPRVGDRLSFEIGLGRGGKLAAGDVDIAGANPRDARALARGEPERPFAPESSRVVVAVVLIVMLMGTAIFDRAPLALPAVYLVTGIVSAFLYWSDKQAAVAGQWRVSERLLHGVDLFGGIIGGLLAQHSFRHKTSKRAFILTTWLIAAFHAAVLALILAGLAEEPVAALLRSLPGYG